MWSVDGAWDGRRAAPGWHIGAAVRAATGPRHGGSLSEAGRGGAGRAAYDCGVSSPAPVDVSGDRRDHASPAQPATGGGVRRRASSRRRYEAYRKTARALDRASRKKGVTDEQLAEQGRKADPHAHLAMSRRRSSRRSRGFWALLREFWRIMGDQRRRIVAALLVNGLATMLGLLPVYATKIVIDYVIGNRPWPDWIGRTMGVLQLPDTKHALLYAAVAGSLLIGLLNLFAGLWARWQATKVGKQVSIHARKIAFDQAVRLPLHRVYDIKSGGVASVLRDDAGGIGELVFSLLYNPSKAVIQLTGSLVILAFIRWELLVGAIAVLPVVWLTHQTWISRIRPIWRDIRHTRTHVDAHATETFGGMRVVRTFNRQRSEASAFIGNNDLMARQELLAWWWMRGIDAAWQIIIPGATALLLLFGGILGMQGKLSAGDLTAFLAYLLWLLQPIAMLATSATTLQNNLAGLDRTLDLLAEPTEFARKAGQVDLRREDVRGHVTIEDLEYAYPKQTGDLGQQTVERGEPVLRGVSLDVPPGTTVALVGPSGAGKTTLCNLIARFYDPTGGRILLDGRDLRDIDIDSYRRLLGIVEQDTFLFDGTIAENIAYGRRDATRADVEAAARQANAHEFIARFPEGYDAFIGERGVKLSGGQRQRLTIARAILADPKILILDEATSNLDTESERLIQASLARLMRGRTSFVIAHRLSTIQGADLIAVVDHGQIVETGTHDELMARSGRYRTMVELQTQPPAPVLAQEREEVAA